MTRIDADQDDVVGLIDPSDRRVEQIGSPARLGVQRSAILAAVEAGHAERPEQVQRRLHRLCVLQVPGNDADPVRLGRLQLFNNGIKGLRPGRRLQLAAGAHIGPVQTLTHQAIAGIARLVRDPLFIDLFIDPRQHAHNLSAACINANGAAQSVHHVDGLSLFQFPRPRIESVGL